MADGTQEQAGLVSPEPCFRELGQKKLDFGTIISILKVYNLRIGLD